MYEHQAIYFWNKGNKRYFKTAINFFHWFSISINCFECETIKLYNLDTTVSLRRLIFINENKRITQSEL